MKVHAVYLGKKLLLKNFQAKSRLHTVLREPVIIKSEGRKHIALFKYGVAVFWGMSLAEQKSFLKTFTPFIQSPVDEPSTETADVIFPRTKRMFKEDKIYLRNLDLDKIALISVVLSRSVALEHYEKEVEKSLVQFEPVIKTLEEKGKTLFSSSSLLKKVGFAMSVRHFSMSQMALLDRPDITWEDEELSRFYDDLSDEYEIDDRYDVLKEKLEIIFRNAEFTVDLIDSRRNLILEFTIVLLIVIEIVIFIYEVWFLG